MSNWNKQKFMTVNSKDPQSSIDLPLNVYMKTDKFVLNGSRYKPLRYSEHKNKVLEFMSINRKHGFDLDKMKYPPNEGVFYNQLKIFIFKLKVFSFFQEKYRLKSRKNLGDILLGTLREGFKFNSEYKKELEGYTREFLRGETDYVYQDFPASHLLPWLDEDPIEKIYVFEDPLPITQKTLNNVISYMNLNIIDFALIRDIDLIDAMYMINNKKMNHLDEKGRTKTSFECRGEELDISFPHYELDYLFKKVTTDPATSRMAGLPTVHTRNVGYAAHSNLDLVTLAKYDYYKQGLDLFKMQNLLSESRDNYFIMVDFKKSGLTTNREVIKSVYRTALEHYPGFRPWSAYLDCLENIRVNGMLSKRGTSLGMDDNALSFFLACAFEGWIDRHPQWRDILTPYFKGDDQVIICYTSLEETKSIFRSWLKRLKHLGLLTNAKKSFIGTRGQFCEIVGRGSGIDVKTIEYSLNCFDALGSYNCVDLKIYLNGVKRSFESMPQRFNEIFDFCAASTIYAAPLEFGISDEMIAPFEMGGYFSKYSYRLNTFIVDIDNGDYKHLDRRLFNLIGIDRPTHSFETKRRKRLFQSIFEDMNTMIDKLRKIHVEPMSAAWKREFDLCQEKRQKAFKAPLDLLSARVQKLIDLKESYALPLSQLVEVPNGEWTFVPSKKYKRRVKDIVQKRPKRLINSVEKGYYLIDEIRAREMLLNAKKGNNEYLINYYTKVPCSTLIWSLCKYIVKSKYGVVKHWAEYCIETKTSLDDLWNYYKSKDINLYKMRPRDDSKHLLDNLFRGPERSDVLMICPYSGFPIKFPSENYFNWRENGGKDKRFFLDLSEHYFYEWFTPEGLEGWYGYLDRNKRVERRKVSPEELNLHNLVVNIEFIDSELWSGYLNNLYWCELELIRQTAEYYQVDVDEITFEHENPALRSLSDYEDIEHHSESDYLDEFFKENPLDSGTDAEENPYNIDSESSE
jgi:hypothetical protein